MLTDSGLPWSAIAAGLEASKAHSPVELPIPALIAGIEAGLAHIVAERMEGRDLFMAELAEYRIRIEALRSDVNRAEWELRRAKQQLEAVTPPAWKKQISYKSSNSIIWNNTT